MSVSVTKDRPAGDGGAAADNILETVGVTKQFGGLTAVNDVSLTVGIEVPRSRKCRRDNGIHAFEWHR